MRKTSLITFVALSVFLSACEKANNEVQKARSHKSRSTSGLENPAPNWLTWQVPEDPPICLPEPGDCLDEVIITPATQVAEIKYDFDNSFDENGVLDASSVGDFFNGGDWATLFPDLNTSYYEEALLMLQSGDYRIERLLKPTGTLYVVVHDSEPSPIDDNTPIAFVLRTN